MERKIVCKPNKEIRPFLVQFFLYLGVTVGGALLLNAQSPLLDKLLVAALALCSLGYGFYQDVYKRQLHEMYPSYFTADQLQAEVDEYYTMMFGKTFDADYLGYTLE